jgi:hypothetical protein
MGENSATWLLALALFLPCPSNGQERGRQAQESTSTVSVVAYEANGRFLGPPSISVFESDKHRNLASQFRNGSATGIRYGVYRIEGRLPGYFPDTKYVRIYGPKATVVLGLRFGAELPEIPPTLRGSITGLASPPGRSFVKLVGVYENVSIESLIDAEGTFNLAGLSSGVFQLLVVGERGVLSSRTLTIPYTGPPIQIEISRDQPAGGR